MTRAHFSGWGIFWVFSGLVIASACGGGDERPPTNSEPPTINAASSSTNGSGGSGGEDGSNETSSTDSGGTSAGGTGGGGGKGAAPLVELLSPEDEDAPDEVYNTSLDVSCQVTQSDDDGATPVDPSTVVIELVKDDEVIDSRPGVEGDDADVYETTFPVQNIESGALTVRCSAADTSTMPVAGSAEVQTFLDHGPLVEVLAPLPDAAESPAGAVVFEYEVLPDELVSDDHGAAIETVELTVKGEDFEITQLDDDEDIYHTTIDFSDPTIFAEVPQGSVSVALTATNARGIAYVERYDFILDGRAPNISIESPGDGEVVGGTVTLVINTPEDASGYNLDTLEVDLNTKPYVYDPVGPWTVGNDRVSFQFESKNLGGPSQITVNVRVEDNAGNLGSTSALYYLDEHGPIVMLDPPLFRGQNDNGQCSYPFDPLGNSPNQAARVGATKVFRALVWDITNGSEGTVHYLAGTDQSSVQLYARKPDAPLVVDTTDDGVCDDIAEEEDLPFQDLTALSKDGSAWYGPNPTENTNVPADADLPDEPPRDGCDFGTSTNPPKFLCDETSDLQVVAHYHRLPGEPIVYAIAPAASGFLCKGREWELTGVLDGYEGWVCLAARARDKVGNRGVSKPLALCVDDQTVEGQPSCWTDLNEAPPDCTDGCDDPPALPAGGVYYYP